MEEMDRASYWVELQGFHALFRHNILLASPKCFPTWKFSGPCPFSFFMEVSLNHWSLLIELNFQLLLSPEGRIGSDESFTWLDPLASSPHL